MWFCCGYLSFVLLKECEALDLGGAQVRVGGHTEACSYFVLESIDGMVHSGIWIYFERDRALGLEAVGRCWLFDGGLSPFMLICSGELCYSGFVFLILLNLLVKLSVKCCISVNRRGLLVCDDCTGSSCCNSLATMDLFEDSSILTASELALFSL